MTSVSLWPGSLPATRNSVPIIPDVQSPTWWGTFDHAANDAPPGYSTHVLRELPRLLVSDVDSTLIEEEVIDQLAIRAGVGPRVAAITEAAMRGELDFAQSLRRRVAQLEGLSVTALQEVAESLHLRPGAHELVDWFHSHGGTVAVVSGGFSPIVKVLAQKLNLDHYLANDLEVVDGHLTGRVSGPIVTAQVKAETLTELRKEVGGPTIAIGDGANDIPMLKDADLGIAILAKPIVKDTIGNYLDFADLSAVIGLAGFSMTE